MHLSVKAMANVVYTLMLIGSVIVDLKTVKCSDLNVYVDAVRGNDDKECVSALPVRHPCKSLAFVANNLPQKELVTIKILNDQIDISTSLKFVNYRNLTIKGRNNSTTICCNESNSGLMFMLVDNLTIVSVSIENCGVLRETTQPTPSSQNSAQKTLIAVYILNCTDVTINNVDIMYSNGTGLSIYHSNGTIDITNCTFNENKVTGYKKGGGGLHILCSSDSITRSNIHNSYIIHNCNFFNNNAKSDYQQSLINEMGNFGGNGGGLYIHICCGAINNNFTIIDSKFVNNTADNNSGGLLAEFTNSVENNTISLSVVKFINNLCNDSNCYGGGLLVSFAQKLCIPKGNVFNCTFCIFENNTASLGAGTSILVTKDNSKTNSIVSFTNCYWNSNISPTGAAVHISPHINAQDLINEGDQFLVPQFVNCSFEKNSAFGHFNTYPERLNISSVGYGAVFSSQVHLQFKQVSYFKDNQGSALYLPNGLLEFSEGSNVTFDNNVGHNGGAIAMYGLTVIVVHNNSLLTFENNRAYSRGGAMYHDVTVELQQTFQLCFLNPQSQNKVNSKLMFQGNKAILDGDIMFITTFKPCLKICPQNTKTDPKAILDCIANFTFLDSTNNSKALLATRPEKFNLNSPVKIIPGAEFYLPLSAYDETNNSLSGLVYAASTDSKNIVVDPSFAQVSSNTIKLLGQIGDKSHLHLETFDIKLSFEVELVDCKPGYIMNDTAGTCICVAEEYLGLVPVCGPTIYLKHGYWMGYCFKNSTKLCTTFCPFGICSYHHMRPTASIHPLPNDPRLLEHSLCGPKRHGKVCGLCTDGYSVYYHSSKYTCGSEGLCHYGWLFYILSELLPLTLLYTIIVLFNISFTDGTLNGCIFFIQIIYTLDISANGLIEYPYFIDVIHNILTFIYSPVNLEFFNLEQLSFCLWKGATVKDAVIMKFVTVVFAFCLVLLTIICARHRHLKFFCLKFSTPNNIIIHGLSAFFIMCYSQVALLTLHMLTYFCLYSTDFNCEEKVVNYIASMKYFHIDHMKYAIPAIVIFLFFILVPQLLLLFYPLMFKILGACKLSESRLARILWKMMPIQLLDSFQGAFKDNMRFFAGLYFVYRTFVLLAFVCCQTLVQFYTVIQLQFVLILTIHSLCQPYKQRKHNVIDSLLFMNLAIINGITVYILTVNDFKNEQISQVAMIIMAIFQIMLMFMPFLYFIVIAVVEWRNKKHASKGLDDLPSLRSCETDPLIHRS